MRLAGPYKEKKASEIAELIMCDDKFEEYLSLYLQHKKTANALCGLIDMMAQDIESMLTNLPKEDYCEDDLDKYYQDGGSS